MEKKQRTGIIVALTAGLILGFLASVTVVPTFVAGHVREMLQDDEVFGPMIDRAVDRALEKGEGRVRAGASEAAGTAKEKAAGAVGAAKDAFGRWKDRDEEDGG